MHGVHLCFSLCVSWSMRYFCIVSCTIVFCNCWIGTDFLKYFLSMCYLNFDEDISHGSPYVSSAVEWRTAVFPWMRNPINWNMVWLPHSHSLIDLENRGCFMKYANSFVEGFYWIHKVCFPIFLRVASQAYTILGYVVLHISHSYLVIISNLLAF